MRKVSSIVYNLFYFQSTEAVVKTLGSVASRIDSPNQAATCASAIKTMTSNKDIVSEDSRVSYTGHTPGYLLRVQEPWDKTVDDYHTQRVQLPPLSQEVLHVHFL